MFGTTMAASTPTGPQDLAEALRMAPRVTVETDRVVIEDGPYTLTATSQRDGLVNVETRTAIPFLGDVAPGALPDAIDSIQRNVATATPAAMDFEAFRETAESIRGGA